MSGPPTAAPPRLERKRNSYPFIDPQNFRGSLTGQVALITGAGRGIGQAIALAFARSGADVVCVSRTKDEVNEVGRQITGLGLGRALGISADISTDGGMGQVIAKTREVFGSINILVNNAGVDRVGSLLHEQDFAAWWHVFEVNMKAPAALTRQVLPDMLSRNKGVIIHIGSRNAIYDHPFMTAYSASKTALLRFHQCLHLELDGANVHTFYLQPGDVATSLMEGTFNPAELQSSSRLRSMVGKMQERMTNNESDSPHLAADTCVALAALPEARLLAGMYLDANQNLEQILDDVRSEKGGMIQKCGLYKLKGEVWPVRSTQSISRASNNEA
ncbi:NAD(P)-binding [Fusarium albosuccineum]|uniref:NAD(P)-binding n=1 Tax=Fusarium albosuccineum TaxID=1237068 RepID=A0A8H4L302_9HYPO|nr:NAD(P)-binding [Fusarium albosuccineum]